MKSFSIPIAASSDSVAVRVAVPKGWPEGGSPTMIVFPDGTRVMFAAVAPSGDAAERLQTAIELQYGDEGGSLPREPLSGGRVWMQRRGSEMIDARVFVPFDRGVVMGSAVIDGDNAKRLPEIKAVLETLEVAR